MKHTPNNWVIILSALASNGKMTSGQLRQQLCLIRGGRYHPQHSRGQYTWYTSSGCAYRSYRAYGTATHGANKMGLDYGYMERLPRDENGVVLYQITELGHEYLGKNSQKPGYGISWRRRWNRGY